MRSPNSPTRAPIATRSLRRAWPLLACALAACAGGPPPLPREFQDALLLQFGGAGRGEMADLVAHRDPRVRAWAARAVGARGGPTALGWLTHLAHRDAAASVRAEACVALLRLHDAGEAVAQALSSALLDADASVRQAAALSLGRCAVGATPHGDRFAAATPREEIVRALTAALHDTDFEVAGAAAWALGCHAAADTRADSAARLQLHALAWTNSPGVVRAAACTTLCRWQTPAAVELASDLLVTPLHTDDDREVLRAAMRGLADMPRAVAAAARVHPHARSVLRRRVAGPDDVLAAAAAAALASDWFGDPVARGDDLRILLEAIAHGRTPRAAAALVRAAVALRAHAPSPNALLETLEQGAVAPNAHVRAACLEGLAAVQGVAALRALRYGLASGEPAVRAGAARGLALLPGLHRDVDELRLAALLDRSLLVARAALLALADANAEPALRTLASLDRELVFALANTLHPPHGVNLSHRLAGAAQTQDMPSVVRALLLRAGSAIADDEDGLAQAMLRAASARLPEHDALVPPPTLPALGRDIPPSWWQTPPRVYVKATAGTFTLALAPNLAPVHVWHLVQRLVARQGPDQVVASDATSVRLGHAAVPRTPPELVLPRATAAVAVLRAGVVSLAPQPLPGLDGHDLCVSKTAVPEWLGARTIVGHVSHGMGVVDALSPGDRILDIAVGGAPN